MTRSKSEQNTIMTFNDKLELNEKGCMLTRPDSTQNAYES